MSSTFFLRPARRLHSSGVPLHPRSLHHRGVDFPAPARENPPAAAVGLAVRTIIAAVAALVASTAFAGVDNPAGPREMTAAAASTAPQADTVTSSAMDTAPTITIQPASATITTGSRVVIGVRATGSPEPTYQWRKDGTDIAGATNETLILANDNNLAGTYTVVVSNSAGIVTSVPAVITVVAPHPTLETVTAGHTIHLDSDGVTGNIQWQVSVDGGNSWLNLTDTPGQFAGTTNGTLAVINATSVENNALFRYTTDSNGTFAASHPILLTVAPAVFPLPTGIAVDGSGTLFVSDANTNTIQKISPTGQVSLLAGLAGTAGSADGTGSAARFNQPGGLVLVGFGTVAVADQANATVRGVTALGLVTTVVGQPGMRGNTDGRGAAATFSSPNSLAVDANGNVYVADAMSNTIRRIAPADNAVTTIAGSPTQTGSADGAGAQARFNQPAGIAVDRNGIIYVSDSLNNTIRRIDPAGNVTTLAGVAGVTGFDDGTGAGALFNHPGGLAVDRVGNIFVLDLGNSTLRRITPAGVVNTIAGLPQVSGLEDGTGDGNVFALFNHPQALCIDGNGNIFIADTGNAAIRKVDRDANVTTFALTQASTGDGGGNTGGGGGGNTGGTGGGGGTGAGGGGTGGTSGGGASGSGGGAFDPWSALALLGAGLLRFRKKVTR